MNFEDLVDAVNAKVAAGVNMYFALYTTVKENDVDAETHVKLAKHFVNKYELNDASFADDFGD